ncbi:UDP-glucose 4-epimerase GalE [Asticcacaulis tiandongensis]|uniref:UDP-glucose 4-epimerase GalE n=1 Tax=Asticcacaulis tiandongensis TaxID=2565365 RepID=UPI0011280A33|nr:UDP-glucose 4-epimerase GalE [Asticcacaulis tiandongensis]
MEKHILVTGGAGYIGSHTCVQLLERGYQVTVLDNYCNSSPQALKRVEQIAEKKIEAIEGDIRNQALLEQVLRSKTYSGVIHFAGLKAVGESSEKPLEYYDNNVSGSLSLIRAMQSHGVKCMIFSSSATVYGDPKYLPLDEAHGLGPVNPYGRTKFMVEEMLRDLVASDSQWSVGLLRYFNPVGAHPSGLIGEDPRDVPNNLMPFISQVAVGRRQHLNVFGGDYDTPDGTGVRDYIHVDDLAKGHVLALETLIERARLLTVNLGTGAGCSVLEMLKAFETACGKPLSHQVQPRRPGDIATSFADCRLAEQELGFRAERTIRQMCEDTWRWQSNNQNGYS